MVAHQLKGMKRRCSVQSNRWKYERHFKCAQMCVFACHMVHREMKWCFATRTISGILYSGENNFIDTIRFYGQNDVSHTSGHKNNDRKKNLLFDHSACVLANLYLIQAWIWWFFETPEQVELNSNWTWIYELSIAQDSILLFMQ